MSTWMYIVHNCLKKPIMCCMHQYNVNKNVFRCHMKVSLDGFLSHVVWQQGIWYVSFRHELHCAMRRSSHIISSREMQQQLTPSWLMRCNAWRVKLLAGTSNDSLPLAMHHIVQLRGSNHCTAMYDSMRGVTRHRLHCAVQHMWKRCLHTNRLATGQMNWTGRLTP